MANNKGDFYRPIDGYESSNQETKTTSDNVKSKKIKTASAILATKQVTTQTSAPKAATNVTSTNHRITTPRKPRKLRGSGF